MISETAANMVSSLHHCLTLFHQQEEVRILQLKEEKEKCRVLEESLNVLAKEHHQLEQSVASHLSERGGPIKNFLESNDDDEFHDAFNDAEGNLHVNFSVCERDVFAWQTLDPVEFTPSIFRAKLNIYVSVCRL